MKIVKFSTTPFIDGYRATDNLGVITTEAVMGVSVVREMVSSIKDFFGGNSTTMSSVVKEGREFIFEHLEKEAVAASSHHCLGIVGLSFDYQHIGTGPKTGMMLITAAGTLVTLEKDKQ